MIFDGPKDKSGLKRGPYSGESDRTKRRKKAIAKKNQNTPVHPAFSNFFSSSTTPNPPLGVRAASKPAPSLHQSTLAAAFSKQISNEVITVIDSDDDDDDDVVESDHGDDVVVVGLDNDDDVVELGSDVVVVEPNKGVSAIGERLEEAELDDSDKENEEVRDAELLDVVDEVLPKTIADFQALAKDGLKLARRAQSYQDQMRFASLSQFYTFLPHLNRIRASQRVAQSIGQGVYFARKLRSNARYFEKHGCLSPSRRGRCVKGGSLLDDEDVLLGIQRWLRVQVTGSVSLVI